MLTYDTIAVGTDGSPTSLRAVRAAASMARAYEAKLIIISAFYNQPGAMLGAPDSESVPVIDRSDAQSYLDEAAFIAQKEGAKAIEVIGKSGDPVKAMLEVEKDYSVDMFVVGNRGMNSVRGRVFGSVATELTRKAQADVVVVNTTSERN
ncbi:MAG: universal stress protein [Corynebacterium casei]|nr:universal stress protein [Corynebacterium casei]